MDNNDNICLRDILLPYQKSVADAPQKKKLLLSSRQVGKSFTMAFCATKKVLSSDKQDSLALCISTGARASSEFLKKCIQMAEAVHIIDPAITYSASADCLKFSGGQRVLSLPSGNPAALRGYTADIIIIDEGAFIEHPDDVWAAIVPTLTRNPEAELIVSSTPAGCNGWFYGLYQEALADSSGSWFVQTTTIEDAVAAGLAIDIDQLKNTVGDKETFEREYMCKFAKAFSDMVDTSILDFIDSPETAPKARWMGMDIGSKSDRTAIVTASQLQDGTFFIEDAAILDKASYEHQLDALKDLHQKYSWQSGFIDSVGIGSPIAEFANKQVSAKIKGFYWTAQNKSPAFEDLRAMCFDRKLKFASHLKQSVIADFNNVHRIVSESGRVSYEAGRDSNGHSDLTSAIVLAIQALKANPLQPQLPAAARVNSVFGNNTMFRASPLASRMAH